VHRDLDLPAAHQSAGKRLDLRDRTHEGVGAPSRSRLPAFARKVASLRRRRRREAGA